MSFTDEELDAAVAALTDPERFREAEAIVARAAPGLQRILIEALGAGGWFASSHEEQARGAAAEVDPEARLRAIRTLLAEETRMGMMVGVAVGWALREYLGSTTRPDDPED
jgi:hypothetical protein